ncbi:MAG: OmpA family protein [Flavobacterium sp.]|jgi:outer membrane protein OmpA-like peptidoglycan-associated protein
MRFFCVFYLLFFSVSAQETEVYSMFFDTNKFNLDTNQTKGLLEFTKVKDTSLLESIQIYGYCDDRGKEDYNFKLSTNRANAVRDFLLENGIKNKIIVTIEGKGRILLEEDIQGDLAEIRSKNRRVDVVLQWKPVVLEELKIPGLYTSIQKEHLVGDRIYLEKLFFESGSSRLTQKSVNELNKIALLMQRYPNLHFEIQGHICCTPKHKKEAIDIDTKKRELSVNRALNVYKYLLKRRISKDRLTYIGLGNSQPLGKDPSMDRRVELVITKI